MYQVSKTTPNNNRHAINKSQVQKTRLAFGVSMLTKPTENISAAGVVGGV
jgi:hypothetical protein